MGAGGYANRAGSLTAKGIFEPPPPDHEPPSQAIEKLPEAHCLLPFRDMNIWADGRAVLCCDDWNEEHVVGDLNTQSLAEIWRGAPLTRARALHKAGRGAEIEICARCNMWRPPMGARLWS